MPDPTTIRLRYVADVYADHRHPGEDTLSPGWVVTELLDGDDLPMCLLDQRDDTDAAPLVAASVGDAQEWAERQIQRDASCRVTGWHECPTGPDTADEWKPRLVGLHHRITIGTADGEDSTHDLGLDHVKAEYVINSLDKPNAVIRLAGRRDLGAGIVESTTYIPVRNIVVVGHAVIEKPL